MAENTDELSAIVATATGWSDRRVENVVAALARKGYLTPIQIALAGATRVSISGILPERMGRIVEACKAATGYVFGTPLANFNTIIPALSSGVGHIDDFLHGGFRVGDRYLLAVSSGSDITPFLIQLITIAQMESGYGGLYQPNRPARVAWIDTTGRARNLFSPRWIEDERVSHRIARNAILRKIGMGVADADQLIATYIDRVLSCTEITETMTSEDQISVVKRMIREGRDRDLALVIVDDVMHHFKSEYVGLANLASRQALIQEHLNDIRFLAGNHAVTMATVNLISDPRSSYVPLTKIPGGEAIANAFPTKMVFKRSRRGMTRVEMSTEPARNDMIDVCSSDNGVEDIAEDRDENISDREADQP
jgi:DNA repair protein RadA